MLIQVSRLDHTNNDERPPSVECSLTLRISIAMVISSARWNSAINKGITIGPRSRIRTVFGLKVSFSTCPHDQ